MKRVIVKPSSRRKDDREESKEKKKRKGKKGRHELNWKKELITRTTVYRHWLIPLVAATFGEVSRERRRS